MIAQLHRASDYGSEGFRFEIILMGYIKEPKGVDFVVEQRALTGDDSKIRSKIIADYKDTGKITRAPWKKKKIATR
jgi:hypothetical protein